ncbi:hypothetical protein [Dactylosporangium sp. CS-033363]|uniref:hypothetical protein n=1 Tax=Dactylosporangium sp. CS-033363 TaxID=3239935 RepID=UPI003D8F4936
MKRSRIGLLCSAAVLTVIGTLPPATATAQPTPEPSAPGSAGPPRHGQHHDMLKNVLHGEGTVETKDGPVRVALQNGEATTVTRTTATVRSSDGFTRSWQLPADLKVYDKRHTLQTNGIQPGMQVTVAGTAGSATATTWTAKWVVVRGADTTSEQPSPDTPMTPPGLMTNAPAPGAS